MAMAMAAADVCRVAVSGCAGRYSGASHVPRGVHHVYDEDVCTRTLDGAG
jgi:hypothetical protein